MEKLVSRIGLVAVMVVVLVGMTGCGGGAADGTAEGVSAPVAAHGDVALDWETDLGTALARAGNENRVVLADFYADWCVWCKKLDSTTLADPRVAGFLAQRVVAVRVDVDGEGRKAASTYRIESLPTVVLLAADGRELGRVNGYQAPSAFMRSVEQLLPAAG